MSHLPFLQFYPADWIRDTQILSLEAQGAWMKILCALHFASDRGRETLGTRRWMQYLGYPDGEKALNLLSELTSVAKIQCRDVDGHICELANSSEITIISNRMISDEMKRIEVLERKRRYEDKRPTRSRRKPDKNTTPIYQKSEVRSQNLKNYEPAPPEPSAGPLPAKNPEPENRPKIDPEIKAAADIVYNADPAKFVRLVVWIKQAEKGGYSKAAIVMALKTFVPYIGQVNGNWWAYLDKLIYKAEPRINSARHEHEHEQRKKAEAEIPEYIKSALGGH